MTVTIIGIVIGVGVGLFYGLAVGPLWLGIMGGTGRGVAVVVVLERRG